MSSKLIIKSIISLLLVIIILGAFVNAGKISNKKSDNYKPIYLKLVIPKGWPKPPVNIFKDNPLTEEGFRLGRKLFYDGRLSKDGNFSCGGCHQQFAAFSTYDHDFSHGFNNSFTNRNAPALFNIAWMKELHWDGGINNIEVQALAPITAHNEMAETINNILIKLQADSSYARMFDEAFGSKLINSQRMLKALAQFTGSIQSYNTKYDQVRNGKAIFTISEQYGYNTFKAKCNACHKEPLFTDNSFRNNGLPINKSQDKGRMGITNDPNDSLKFKVPSLRNITLTLPYMHDGRFYTFTQVINHYRKGIHAENNPTLDPLLTNGIIMTEQEKTDLVSFLYTLSDSTLLHDPRLAQPKGM